MELAMTNGFSELTFSEMEMVDGGVNWDSIGNFITGTACAAIGVYVTKSVAAKAGATVGTFLGGPGGAVLGAVVGGAIGVAIYTLWD